MTETLSGGISKGLAIEISVRQGRADRGKRRAYRLLIC